VRKIVVHGPMAKKVELTNSLLKKIGKEKVEDDPLNMERRSLKRGGEEKKFWGLLYIVTGEKRKEEGRKALF